MASKHARSREMTLLELVAFVAEFARSERELVATVDQLVRSGRVRLVGSFCRGHLAPAGDLVQAS